MEKIYILGVGHATPIFIELAEACGYEVVGLYHYNNSKFGSTDHGYRILGSFDDLYHSSVQGKNFVLSMGNMRIKQEVSFRLLSLGAIIPTLVHPSAIISRFSSINECGVLIGSQCEVHSDSIIGEGCVLWPRSTVEHDCHIHNYVFIGPNAYVGAYTEIKDNAFIGQCSILISDKAKLIEESALVGAGALVTKPVLANSVVVGHPARTFVSSNNTDKDM